MQSACAVFCCQLWPLWRYPIFPHYLINGAIFGKKLLEINCVFWFSLQLFSEIFLILGIIQRDVFTKVKSLHVKYQLFLSDFNETWISQQIFDKTSNTKFNQNTSSGSRVVPCRRKGRRTDMTKLIVAFRNFADAPKNAALCVRKLKWQATQSVLTYSPDSTWSNARIRLYKII